MPEKEVSDHCSLNDLYGLNMYKQKESLNKHEFLTVFGVIFF